MQRKLNFWDYVFYLSLLVLTIWVILKITGIIQTPLWLEYGIPIFTLILTTLAFYKNLLDNIKEIALGLSTLNVKFGHLENKVDKIDKKVDHLEKDVGILKTDIEILKRKA